MRQLLSELCCSGSVDLLMQPPVNIPSRRPASSPTLQGAQFGSPDPFNSHDQLLPTDTDSILGPSTPMLSSQLLSTSSPRRQIQIGLPGSHPNSFTHTPPAHHRERLPDHQWSLFGQLMENEGFLPITPQSTPQRGSAADYFARDTGISSGSSPRPASIGASYSQHSLQVSSRDAVNDSPVNEYDNSDTYSSDTSTYHPPTPLQRPWFSFLPFRQFSLSIVYRNILKCAVAYFIASLFTFSPFLSRIISDMNFSPSASGHMVATM